MTDSIIVDGTQLGGEDKMNVQKIDEDNGEQLDNLDFIFENAYNYQNKDSGNASEFDIVSKFL